jgi:hypothetical protein
MQPPRPRSSICRGNHAHSLPLTLVRSPNMILMFYIFQQLKKNLPFAVSRPLLLSPISTVCSTLLQIRLQIK